MIDVVHSNHRFLIDLEDFELERAKEDPLAWTKVIFELCELSKRDQAIKLAAGDMLLEDLGLDARSYGVLHRAVEWKVGQHLDLFRTAYDLVRYYKDHQCTFEPIPQICEKTVAKIVAALRGNGYL